LAFRDALCADSDLRQRYAALKQELATHHHANDREVYTAGKADFVYTALDRRPT